MKPGDFWDLASPSWRDEAAGLAQAAQHFNRYIIDAIRPQRGDRILDLAAGVGEPALTLAGKVGQQGQVVALDISVLMVRALQARLSRTELVEQISPVAADMRQLPFAAGVFNAITCRFGVMFVPPVPALAEMRRVLCADGRVALLLWGRRQDNPLLDAMFQVASNFLGAQAMAINAMMFRDAEAGALDAAAAECGFADIQSSRIDFTQPSNKWQAQWRMLFGNQLEPAQRPIAEQQLAELLASAGVLPGRLRLLRLA